jgi:hypothetical protein
VSFELALRRYDLMRLTDGNYDSVGEVVGDDQLDFGEGPGGWHLASVSCREITS